MLTMVQILKGFTKTHLRLNFVVAFAAIAVCVLPKLVGFTDSFNKPDTNDIYDKETMKISAFLLFILALPTAVDFLLDIFHGHNNQDKAQELKKAHFIAALSYIFASLDILAKLGYFPLHITSPSLHINFEFLVWCVRLNTTASLMTATNIRNPDLFPVWKTVIVTLAVSSHGLLRYVVPLGYMYGTYHHVLLATRTFLVTCVHYMYCVWVYKFWTHHKWTVNDYGVLFYVLVFTFLTLDFISNTIYVTVAKYLSSNAVVYNIDKLRVERSIISLVIANVVFSVISGRLAKMEIEMRVSKLETYIRNY